MTNPHPLGDDGVKMKDAEALFKALKDYLFAEEIDDPAIRSGELAVARRQAEDAIAAWSRRAVPSPKAEWRGTFSALESLVDSIRSGEPEEQADALEHAEQVIQRIRALPSPPVAEGE